MKDGIYGLFQLEGDTLNTPSGWLEAAGPTSWSGAGAAFTLRDSAPLPGDSGCVVAATQIMALLGDIDNLQALIRRYALADTSAGASVLWTIIRQHGPQALNQVEGLWTLLVWDTQTRELTLISSRHLRDTLFYSCHGQQMAVSPSMRHLQALSWVGPELDASGLLLSVGRAALRSQLEDRSCLRDVRHLTPGSMVTWSASGLSRTVWILPLQADQWQGTFEQAVQEMESRARQAVRNSMRRHRTLAILLSGGLDSSLLAWLAVTELRPDQRLFAVSSVANADSGLEDERAWIAMVAATLGIAVIYVTPAVDANACLPSDAHFAHNSSPVHSPRHYIYENLFAAAAAAGADAILDGCYGEQSLTRRGKPPPSFLHSLRRALREARQHLQRKRDTDIPQLFHARISARARLLLPSTVFTRVTDVADRTEGASGFPQGYAKAAHNSGSTTIDGLRRLLPFRSPPLLCLSAALPAAFFDHQGQARAMARALLARHFPAALAQRTDKKPFCPEHARLLKRSAAQTLIELDAADTTAAALWIDVDWLRAALHKLALGEADDLTRDMAQASCSALAFLQWQARLRPEDATG